MKVNVDLLLRLRKDHAWSHVKGKIVEIADSWLKLAQKKESVYINISHIKRIIPQ